MVVKDLNRMATFRRSNPRITALGIDALAHRKPHVPWHQWLGGTQFRSQDSGRAPRQLQRIPKSLCTQQSDSRASSLEQRV